MSVLATPQHTLPAGPHAARLPGDRLHLNEGPIDLVIGAEGAPDAVAAAYAAAAHRFDGLLRELVTELPLLRSPIGSQIHIVGGKVAKRMVDAVFPHRRTYVTPMAAVAGAVADEIRAVIAAHDGIGKAYVNNGGDIALHLAPGQHIKIGLVTELQDLMPNGTVTISAADSVRGIATSGMHGRSLSLGIADAVTVLAPSAAAADAGATLIANAVNADHHEIRRVPANELDPDSDLGDRLVTVERPPLPEETITEALENGAACARSMRDDGLIEAALLACDGRFRSVEKAQAVAVKEP